MIFVPEKIIGKANPMLVELGIHTTEFRLDYEGISRELEEFYKDEDYDSYYEMLQEVGKKDLFAFAFFILDLPVDDPFLLARIYEAQDHPDQNINLWAREHWKAIDIHEPVFTPRGWKDHGALEVGDFVFSGNGKPVSVVAKTEIFENADCYEIVFNDGYSITCSGEHLWEVEKRTRVRKFRGIQDRETTIMSTVDIFNYGTTPDNRLTIKSSPIFIEQNNELPIHPYVLGAWLGDGHSACGRITNNDEEVWQEIIKAGYNIQQNNRIDKTVYGIMPILRSIGVLNNKHIPYDYILSNYNNRLMLLNGMIDTDGTIDKRGTITFTNINKRLSDGFYTIAASLGLNPSFREHRSNIKGDNYIFYNVSFQGYDSIDLFRINRKKKRLKCGKHNPKKVIVDIKKVKSIPVSCIQVEGDGTYIVGKNFTKTHNSTIGSYARPLWKTMINPENTTGIISFDRGLALSHLRPIKIALENNVKLKSAFPDVCYKKPKTQSEKWSERDGLLVKRKQVHSTNTFEAYGLIESMPTGKHFMDLTFDDIVDPNTVATPGNIRKAIDAFNMSDNIGARGGVKNIYGTRYKFNDPYSEIMEKQKGWRQFIYPAEVDDQGLPKRGGTPVYLTTEELDKKYDRQGPYIYFCQMLQFPVDKDSQTLKPAWLDYYEVLPEGKLNYYIVVDSAKKKRTGGSLDHKIDYTVMIAFCVDGARNKYILDMVRDKIDLLEKWDRLREMSQKWGIVRIGYEQFGAMTDKEYMEIRGREEGVYLDIEELNWKAPKPDRIMTLVPDFKQRKIKFPKGILYQNVEGKYIDLVAQFVEEEYNGWPFSKKDDILDCLSKINDPKLCVVYPVIDHYRRPREKFKNDPFDSDKDGFDEDVISWEYM